MAGVICAQDHTESMTNALSFLYACASKPAVWAACSRKRGKAVTNCSVVPANLGGSSIALAQDVRGVPGAKSGGRCAGHSLGNSAAQDFGFSDSILSMKRIFANSCGTGLRTLRGPGVRSN